MSVDKKSILTALFAYIIWGCFPLFFMFLRGVSVFEILGHRIVWSAGFLLLAAKVLGRLGDLWAEVQSRRGLANASFSALFLTANWGVFIYAVEVREVLAATLGHMLTPLVSMLLGYLIFSEHISRLQASAVLISLIALSIQFITVGQIPWITVFQTATFSIYGLLHKKKETDGFVGMFLETLILLPIGIMMILTVEGTGSAAFTSFTSSSVLLILSGAVTATPLLAFSVAAKRLPLGTLGFFTGIIPTLQFFVAIVVMKEPFSVTSSIVYGACWVALILYLVSVWRVPGSKKI